MKNNNENGHKNTPGGRLRKFWPKNRHGDNIQIQEWAKIIGIGHQTLGEVLRDVKDFRWQTYSKIIRWMVKEGYTEEDVFFFLCGDLETVLEQGKE